MPAPRITRELAKPKREKNPRRQPEHQAFIRNLAHCLCCGKPGSPSDPIQCAHIRLGTDGGTSLRPSDRYTVPLLSSHHRRQHDKGEVTFWASVGIDPTPVAERLWVVSGNIDQGMRALERAWQTRKAA